jgi:hypothetical protein
LNPTVCELARLLPTTSICVSAAVMPVRAVVSADAKPILCASPWLGERLSSYLSFVESAEAEVTNDK